MIHAQYPSAGGRSQLYRELAHSRTGKSLEPRANEPSRVQFEVQMEVQTGVLVPASGGFQPRVISAGFSLYSATFSGFQTYRL
ncbi:hypothetical protein SAMN05216486_10320 [bacterium JGI 053]|nr:hypothetical protein SAMN05216486_10320 [bacterium JGI 053]